MIIKYTQFRPIESLDNYISAYWFFRSDQISYESFEILPDGYFDLVITIKDGCVSECRLVGIWSRRVTVESAACNQIGIRFKPYSLIGLLNLRIADLLNTGTSFELSDWGIDESIFVNYSPEQLVDYWNNLFLKKLNQGKNDKRLLSVFNLIENTNGIITVKELSNWVGLSDRQIRRRTNELIGIGVKEYIDIIRFKKR